MLKKYNNYEARDRTERVELYGLKFLMCNENYRIHSSIDRDHFHSLWELHLMQTGRQTYRINGQDCVLEAGEFLLICPRTAHCLNLEGEPFSKFSLLMRLPLDFHPLPASVLEQIQQEGCVKANATPAMSGILQYLFENVGIGEQDSLSDLRFCMAIFLHAMIKCLQKIYGVSGSAEVQNQPEQIGDVAFCERVIAYMKDNVSDTLYATEVADRFFISSRHLNRKLQSCYGKSYSVIVDQVRSDCAKDMLCFSEASVAEIAARVGYSNISNFIRFFKRVEGQSPSKFRRMFHEMNRGHI